MVIRESIKLAKNQPSIFLPKAFYISLSSLWILGFLSSFGKISYYVLSMPFLIYLSFFSSVMVASIAKASEKNLKYHFKYVLSLKKDLAYLVITLFVISFLISVPIAAGIFLILEDIYLYLGYALVLSGLVLSLLSSFFLYFLPISLIENSNLNSVMQESYQMSRNNSKEVFFLFVISIILLGLSQISEGVFQDLSIIGFLSTRVIESIASTYVFILGSNYYLEKIKE